MNNEQWQKLTVSKASPHLVANSDLILTWPERSHSNVPGATLRILHDYLKLGLQADMVAVEGDDAGVASGSDVDIAVFFSSCSESSKQLPHLPPGCNLRMSDDCSRRMIMFWDVSGVI